MLLPFLQPLCFLIEDMCPKDSKTTCSICVTKRSGFAGLFGVPVKHWKKEFHVYVKWLMTPQDPKNNFLLIWHNCPRKLSRVDLLLSCCVFSCLLISFWSSMLFIPDTPNLTAQRHSSFSLLHTLYFLGPGLDSIFPAQLQVLNVDWNKDFKTEKWVVSLRCDARQLPNFENQRRE